MVTFDVRTTAYGRAAGDLLATQVKEIKGGDPLAPVTVIVPSNYAAVATRRALAAQPGGVANVSFVTLYRLAERLGASGLAAAGRRPTSAPLLVQATRAVLATDPGVFSLVAEHPATELALAGAARELAGLTDGALNGVAAGSPRAADVVRIARRVRAILAPSWHDEHDLLAAATVAVRGGADIGPVVVHLLQELSPAGAELLRALAERTTVRVNTGLTGHTDADRHVLEAHARAGISVPPGQVERARSSAAISVSDPDEEVRAAVRLVTDWMRAGVRLGRIALLYGTADPYARILHEQLAAAGLPHNGSPVHAIGDMLLGRTLRRLLALPDRRFRRSDVMAVVTGAPVLEGAEGNGGADGWAPSRAWDRISRAAAVVDGDDWERHLGVFSHGRRRRADEADHEERDRLADHLRLDAVRAEQLVEFVGRLRSDLASLESGGSWVAMVERVKGLIEAYLGDERHRRRWPEEEQQAADRVEEALERLAVLDQIGGPPPTVEIFRRTLDGELEVALRRIGRFGDGVLVGHVSMAVGLDLDRVVVLGMAEGAFPARRIEDSLLHDDERLAAGGELRLRAERLHDDHRQLLAAMAAGPTTLCFPRGDLRRQGDRAASRWLLADAAYRLERESAFTDDLPALQDGWYRHVPSYASGLGRIGFPATTQELRLATMLRDADSVSAADPVIAAGMEMARARTGNGFTRFDGNLGGLRLPDYASSQVVSATRLQKWAECPHAFFMEYLLGVEVLEDPERTLEMNHLDKGSLVHEILERFVTEQIAAGRVAPWDEADRARLWAIATEVGAEYRERGATGRAMFWRRDLARILADLERFAAEDRGHPVHAEWPFDKVPYRLPDGRSVFFGGKVDRVDEVEPGLLRVLDYKTGKAKSYKDLCADSPHKNGTRLQLAVYATAVAHDLGAVEVEAGYWFVTNVGDFERIGYPVTPEIQEEVGRALATIVDGIRAGVFPVRPAAEPKWSYVDCWYCAADGLSTNELRRDWERKRLDPLLADYVRLCEPEVLDDHA